MGDMDQNNQFQPTILCDDAKVTVAQQTVNKAAIMNITFIPYILEIISENFAVMTFLFLMNNATSTKNSFSSLWFSAHFFVE